MKAIVNTAPGQLELRDWPTPTPGPGQVRIRTTACGICATDLKMIAGWERTGCPAIPGHEWAGVIDALGPDVTGLTTGRPCVADNVWPDGGEVGFEHPGGYAEYLVTAAANVRTLPDGFAPHVAALIEPLAVTVRALRRLRLANLDSALVCGDGPIGLIALLLLRRAGVRDVVLVGGRPGRLALARSLGAAATLSYHDLPSDLASGIRAAWPRPFPSAIEATGTSAATEACLTLAAPGGKVLLVGDYEDARAAFAWQKVLIGELEIIGSNASAGAWDEAVALATGGTLPLERLVTQRLPAARFTEGVELVRSRRPDVVKVVLEW
jgi:D-arabinitol dehydrogenase (NADP+)